MLDPRQACGWFSRGLPRLVLSLALLGFVACGPATISIEHSVELPTASCGVPFEILAEHPWPVMEIRKEGSVYLDGVRVVEPGDEEMLGLRGALYDLALGLPETDRTETFRLPAIPVVVLADRGTPYAIAEQAMECLRYRGIQFGKAMIGVRNAPGGALRGMSVEFGQDIGIVCFEDVPETIAHLAWFRDEPGSPGDSRVPPVFRVSRVEASLPESKEPPTPTYIEHPPRTGAELSPWLKEAADAEFLVSFEATEIATWQDFILLLDLAVAARVDFIEGYYLESAWGEEAD